MKPTESRNRRQSGERKHPSIDPWKTVGDFTLGYMECALWSSHDYLADTDRFLDEDHCVGDFAPETVVEMVKDCDAFASRCSGLLEESGLADWSAGADFWLARSGHGVGFDDRGLGEVGRRLAVAARKFGQHDLCVGEDGRIYAI